MEDRIEFISESAEQTKKYAHKFAQQLQKGGVVALYGELGAGKTTFVQGLAEGLGIEKRIISPTFVIMRTYEISKKQQATSNRKKTGVILASDIGARPESLRQAQGKTDSGQARMTISESRTIKNFYHIDLYRTESLEEVRKLGIRELFKNPENLVVIEWAEKMKENLPEKRYDIFFEDENETNRKIVVKRLE